MVVLVIEVVTLFSTSQQSAATGRLSCSHSPMALTLELLNQHYLHSECCSFGFTTNLPWSHSPGGSVVPLFPPACLLPGLQLLLCVTVVGHCFSHFLLGAHRSFPGSFRMWVVCDPWNSSCRVSNIAQHSLVPCRNLF